MKSLSLFLCLFAVGALMTACQKETIKETSLKLGSPEWEQKMQEDYAKYVEKHGEIQIEYMSLEELNDFNVKHGMEVVTLEGLGVTKEEYDDAQARINNPEVAKSRCNNFYWALIDMNGSGTATGFDLFLATRVIRGQATPSDESEDFGTISYWQGQGDGEILTSFDVSLANQMILGIITC